MITRINNKILSVIFYSSLVMAMFAAAIPLSAFEAHIINVTAKICDYSKTYTMGYWKNHPEIYAQYLPQTLGDEVINILAEANQVFLDYNLSMRNKLRGQLLAMKFNIAAFGIGGYYVESEGKTLAQIVAEADALLSQDPPPPDSVLEDMKDLLDYLNNLHSIKFCSGNNSGWPLLSQVVSVYFDDYGSSDPAPLPPAASPSESENTSQQDSSISIVETSTQEEAQIDDQVESQTEISNQENNAAATIDNITSTEAGNSDASTATTTQEVQENNVTATSTDAEEANNSAPSATTTEDVQLNNSDLNPVDVSDGNSDSSQSRDQEQNNETENNNESQQETQ